MPDAPMQYAPSDKTLIRRNAAEPMPSFALTFALTFALSFPDPKMTIL